MFNLKFNSEGYIYMKKYLRVISFILVSVIFLSGCSQKETSTNNGDGDMTKVSVAAQATSGQVFHFMADEKGFLKEEGLDAELVYINNGTDAFSALSSGQVDVISTYGTGGPLIQIANGQDFTIFGGYMIIGATPVFSMPETKFESIEDFRGKKIAIMRGGTPDIVLKGILYDAGFDLEKDVTFVELKKNTEVMEAVRNGEVDFGAVSTGFELKIKEMGMKIDLWPDELWPNHSCCRMIAKTSWLKENPETAEKLVRSYLKAEEAMQGNMGEVVDLVVKNLDIPKETVESFVLSEHMKYETDPYKNSVIKMWEKMQSFNYIKDPDIKIEDHINTDIYLAALNSLAEAQPENEFYKAKELEFKDNNL